MLPLADPTTPPELVLRPVLPQCPEFEAFLDLAHVVFKADRSPSPQRVAYRRTIMAQAPFNRGRCLAAFDGQSIVGTLGSWPWGMTLPGAGASVEVQAISMVTVSPTHRRRGVMSALLRSDLELAREQGRCAATLLAARATIYGRFGFGPTTHCQDWVVRTGDATLRESAPTGGRVEFVSPARARELAPAIFEASRRPGCSDRAPWYWDQELQLVAVPDAVDVKPLRHLVHWDQDGVPQGYLAYSWKDEWKRWDPAAEVSIEQWFAATPQAYAALADVVVNLDNVVTVNAQGRPLDEPLPWLLTDFRALQVRAVDDLLWTRILDVPMALSSREYEQPGRCVIQVRDPLGYTDGSYFLQSFEDGLGQCTPTDQAPDVVLNVDVLSSLWLGSGDLAAAVAAGRAHELTPGAAIRLSSMLATRQPPWCSDHF